MTNGRETVTAVHVDRQGQNILMEVLYIVSHHTDRQTDTVVSTDEGRGEDGGEICVQKSPAVRACVRAPVHFILSGMKAHLRYYVHEKCFTK